jgi:glycosyltransferase involved in cell wall biosynthesis
VSRIGLLVSLTAPARGRVEDAVLELLQRLDPAEFRLALVAPPALLDSVTAELHGMPVDIEAAQADSWLRRRDVSRLSAFIGRVRPHIVSTHGARATLVAAPLAKWQGARVVETCHGGGDGSRTRLLPHRMVARFVDRAIAVSEAARALLVAAGYPADKVVVIPDGCDVSTVRAGVGRDAVRRELGIEGGIPLVGVFGPLEPRRGHAELFEAWPSIVAEFPAARLVVIGDGSLRPRLDARARDLGLHAAVIFAGHRADLARVLDAVDVVTLPALSEGPALIAIQAAAMGRPVVATAVDGMPEVIREARTGRLVPPADPAALSRAIRGVLRDPFGAQRMGRAGRDFVLDRFSLDRQVSSTVRVYRDVVGAPRRLPRAA